MNTLKYGCSFLLSKIIGRSNQMFESVMSEIIAYFAIALIVYLINSVRKY